MQTQLTEPTRKIESVDDVLRRTYSRNHENMEDFPVFKQQFHKTQNYLRQNHADVEKRVYFAHLLSEVGATPLVLEQAVGLALSPEPMDAFLLYSLKVALKRTGQTKAIEQYEPFQSEHVVKYETESGPDGYKYTPLPKKHWWSKQKYDVKVIHPRTATFGEIEFLRVQLGEQKW